MTGGGPAPASLPDLLAAAAAAWPERVALEVDGVARLTYGDWQARSQALAAGLRRRGVAAGDRIVLRFDAAGWCDHAVAFLGVLRVGAVAVPVASSVAEPELGRVLAHCRASTLVAPPDLAPAGLAVPVAAPAALEAEAPHGPAAEPADPFDPDAPVELLYRPGVLAPALGVARSQRDVPAGLPLPPGARPPASLVHAFPPGSVAGQDALRGCLGPDPVSAVVLPAFDPERLCRLLAGSVEACGLHPAAAEALLASGAAGRHDLSGVSEVLLACGRPEPSLLVALAAAFPHAALLSLAPAGDAAGTPTVFAHDRSRPGAVGRPVDGTGVSVADDAGRALPAGQVGDAGDGGLGFVDDAGCLYLLGSRREVVRRGGITVCRGEVEAVLRRHPAVADAALLGTPDDREASGLVAAVVLSSPTPEAELRAHVAERLGAGKVPERVAVTGELPRNGAGMLLDRRLRRRLGLDDPGRASAVGDRPGVDDPAAGELGDTVAALWRRVLGRRDVAADDDFFELGGDGIAAARVLDLLADAAGVRLPAGALLGAPTVAGLAAALERAGPAQARRRPPDAADAAEADVAPAAPSQQGMLWHECFAPGCQNLPGLARRYRGRLDVAALAGALDEIVRRHEPLRSGFEIRGGRLVQVVRRHRRLDVPVVDLAGLDAGEQQAAVARLVTGAGARPFDLVGEPLFAATLLRLAADDHVLVLRTHHSVFDDWSVGVFRRELAALYAAFAEGTPSPLPEPPLTFAEFSRRQRRRLAGRPGERQMAFWRRELAGAPLVCQLPVDDPALPEGCPQPAGEPLVVRLPAELSDRLRRLARSERVTGYMVLLAAFGVVVQRYTGQDDLVLATVVANRNRKDLEGLIGCFTKKVPLRLRLSGDPTFSETLARARGALLGALAHQDLAFDDIVQDVLGPAAAAHGLVPHLAVMFQGETPRQELSLPDVESSGLHTTATARRAHFLAGEDRRRADGDASGDASGDERGAPGGRRAAGAPGGPSPAPGGAGLWGAGLYLGTFLILSLDESGDELALSARGAFHRPAVDDLLAAFRTLLVDAVADPGRPVSRLALLDGKARTEALAQGRGPAAPLPAGTVDAIFDTQARATPQAPAVSGDSEALTYAELDARVGQLAARLREEGAGPGATVGIALGSSVEAVVAALAAWRAGAAWVGLDPGDAPERLTRVVAGASIALVVSDSGLRLPARVPVLSAAGEAAGPGTPATGQAPRPAAPAAVAPTVSAGASLPDAAAVVFYGSGSAALPGAIVLDHRAVRNLAGALHRRVGGSHDARRVGLSAAPSEDGFLRQVVAVLDGHALTVVDPTPRHDPSAALRLVARGEVDVLHCTPAEADALLDAGLEGALAARPAGLGRLHLVVGDRQEPEPRLWRRLRALTGMRPAFVYGPPECAFAATAADLAASGDRPTVGRPLGNVVAHVLDRRGEPVPARAVGELHLGGVSLARDGPGAAGAGRGHFVDSTLDGGHDRLWASGRLARRLPDGDVELLGPAGGDGGLRGFRVDPDRVTAALADYPGTAGITVRLRRDGDEPPCLVAEACVDDGPAPTVAALRAFLWARLPGYACPSEVTVAGRDAAAGATAGGGERRGAAPGADWRATMLSALWEQTASAGRVPAGANYWQAFSFLQAIAGARAAGLPVASAQVVRNRTVETLATDLRGDPPGR